MSIKSSLARRIAGVALSGGLVLGGLALPTAAHADVLGTCVPVPVTTPGVTVLSQHVAAISNVELCAFAGVWTEIRTPTLTMYSGCGNPCFALRADLHPVQGGFNGASVTLRWREDGIEKYPIGAISIPGDGQTYHDPQTICIIAVGTPTPAC